MGTRTKVQLALLALGAVQAAVVAVITAAFHGSVAPDHTTPHDSLSWAASPARQCPPEVSPSLVSLGILAPGQPAGARFLLRNPGPHTVSVERVKTSCPCLRVEAAPFIVGPGGSAELVARFDPADDPDFRGGLSIEVTGLSPAGEAEFRVQVDLEVQAEPRKDAARGAADIPPLPGGGVS